jgi:peptidoglycan/xylan/chitin deacetylase (PgdA/CDA1 family)
MNEPGYQEFSKELFNGLSAKQIKRISENHFLTIGSHTVSHPFLTKISNERLDYELSASRYYLEQITNTRINLLAYPAGDYDYRVIRAAKATGYIAAFAENSRNIGYPRYEIPRIGIYSPDKDYLDAKLSGLFSKPLKGSVL